MKLFDFLLKSRQMKREVEDPANYTWVNPHLPPDIVTISRADYDKLMANQRGSRKRATKAITLHESNGIHRHGDTVRLANGKLADIVERKTEDYSTLNAQETKEEPKNV